MNPFESKWSKAISFGETNFQVAPKKEKEKRRKKRKKERIENRYLCLALRRNR
jgi:hypothetical protein